MAILALSALSAQYLGTFWKTQGAFDLRLWGQARGTRRNSLMTNRQTKGFLFVLNSLFKSDSSFGVLPEGALDCVLAWEVGLSFDPAPVGIAD